MRTIVCAIFGYFFLLLTVRVLARRPGAQLTPFEFVLIFLVGGVGILATVGDDHSMTNCFSAVIAVGLLHRLVALAKQKSPKIGALVDGTPVVILEKGKWYSQIMRTVHVQEEDVMAAARTKGVRSFDGIKYAILERIGSISIIRNK